TMKNSNHTRSSISDDIRTILCSSVNMSFFFSSRRRHTISVSGIPAEPLFRSGLTPSQLYVFMPPNLGGFFMVRSYYPSECHADYFDFERIEALKPAIEACGISTLSQSPMLGFHKQMDNRIKLL